LIVEHVRGPRPLRVLDLGTGTGSNIRFLAPLLAGEQHWLAADKEPRLLAEAAARSTLAEPPVHVETRALDLGALGPSDIFDGRHLVTASALLDLVSERWLEWVAGECRRVGASALFTITYNGRNECEPADADDGRVFELFNRHQRTDKGLGGPAAGPRATEVASRCFQSAGFEVRVEPSDWQIAPDAREFQRQLIEGWASAAGEMLSSLNDLRPQFVADWKQRRLDHVAAGRSRLRVGHHDLAAIRPSPVGRPPRVR
jgi:hypothetical protein